ncbi:hypothetical protein BO94DRAFT_581901 [Aspergillus sclerotioniger CBS 115572]|uniref:Fungal-type protein kinase domain-containing protein n=1 Tax=Aspergillus sclerotioniger CBS 115572 TaxID=1450535 RepID=A0A317X7J5_9EURO|nr:hypothetical protein BO94DRAFT_581901 [Aspergillus sclerotioniger CBS 115572]PWY94509.1 hypothetical protein BO94DRAFT_581901 [Aspergillus sclerotioniger CBS 115572]
MTSERINLAEGDNSELVNLFRLGISLTYCIGQNQREDVWDIDPDRDENQILEYLQQVNDIFCLGLESRVVSDGERLISTRMDIFLLVVLAIAKKIDMQTNENGFKADVGPYWVSPYDLTVEQVDVREPRTWRTRVDYILRYGELVDVHTNLVVLRKSTREFDGGWGVLAVLSAIYNKRKNKEIQGDIYGICTDSYQWIFYHVDSNGLYSRQFLLWTEEPKQIIRHLCRIIRQATTLAQKGGGFINAKPLENQPGNALLGSTASCWLQIDDS